MTLSARYAFPTEEEFRACFNPMVTAAAEALQKYAVDHCAACAGSCCHEIGCGFRSVRFGSCPIFEYRPVACRLYYCEKVLEDERLTAAEKALLERPVAGLADFIRDEQAFRLPFEPQAMVGELGWLALLGIEKEVRDVVKRVEEGAYSADVARGLLLDVVRRCRGEGDAR